jgi:hypothetical protein
MQIFYRLTQKIACARPILHTSLFIGEKLAFKLVYNKTDEFLRKCHTGIVHEKPISILVPAVFSTKLP